MDSSTSKEGGTLLTPSWLLWGSSRWASFWRSQHNIGRRARAVRMFPLGGGTRGAKGLEVDVLPMTVRVQAKVFRGQYLGFEGLPASA